ncbi:MAG: hypothetical protein ISP94_04330 [SAR86 cluster bacterium]|nr:hypothetical protein [SAR86 cluster bacterium]
MYANKFEILSDSEIQFQNNTVKGISCFNDFEDSYLCFYEKGKIIKSSISPVIICNKEDKIKISKVIPNAVLLETSCPRVTFIKIVKKILNQAQAVKPVLFSNLGESAPKAVNPNSYISNKAYIHQDATIGSNCFIGDYVYIGKDVSIEHGSIIGSTGTNRLMLNGQRLLMPHLGATILEDKVIIKSNTVITRGNLTNTIIGSSSIIGNLCNIGHGTQLGTNCWIASGTVIGGHTIIGNDVNIGLNATIRDGLNIGDNANVGMGSVVTKNIASKSSVFGNPAKLLRKINSGPR